jgi:threonyl-tRNA synthetase
MKRISKDNKLIKRIEISKKEAFDMFKNDEYKIDLISRMDEGNTTISAYKQDNFIDLCRGPHVESTKAIKFFKLLKVSGAYWKGDAKNKMLQRIYGICFDNEEDLNEYLYLLEEAKKRRRGERFPRGARTRGQHRARRAAPAAAPAASANAG